jgi:hypothetical protein
MENRDVLLLELRGDAIGIVNTLSSNDEVFQNETLRPILKLQNDLFIEVFKNHINKTKVDFENLTVDRKMQFIENSIQKDIKFRNALKGIVIGLFSVEEYSKYIKNSSELNKRMMNMLIERLKNQVQLF